jgi:hypothetical protein
MDNFFVRPNLQDHFARILSRWKKFVERYSDNNRADSLFMYNERATLSTFAYSIVLEKCFALEEYNEIKNKNNKNYIGRVDLWCNIKNTDYVFEAKQIWPSINSASIKKQMQRGLKSAFDDTKKFKKFGMLFVVPCAVENDVNLHRKKIKEFINICNEINPAMWAYAFPKNAEIYGARSEKFYPFVFLLATDHLVKVDGE